MKKINRVLNFILPLLPIAIIIALWAILACSVNNQFILPTVKQTVKSFVGLFADKDFYLALGGTLLRAFIAFIISFVLATALAYASKKSRVAERVIMPIISVTRALPTIAVVLLLLLWTNSLVAPVIVTMLVVLPTTYTNAKNAFDSVDSDAVEMCNLFKVDKKTIFFKVQLPQVAPEFLSTVGAGLSLNLKLMVAAEVLSSTARSIGFMLKSAKYYFETAEMIALVCVCVILGLIIELTFGHLSKKAGEWRD